jgi:hypothetical protein
MNTLGVSVVRLPTFGAMGMIVDSIIGIDYMKKLKNSQ